MRAILLLVMFAATTNAATETWLASLDVPRGRSEMTDTRRQIKPTPAPVETDPPAKNHPLPEDSSHALAPSGNEHLS